MKKRGISFETCQKEAKKYNFRKDFRHNSPKEYATALRKNWIDVVCDHMFDKNREYEYAKKEALRFKTKRRFEQWSREAFENARKNGWLNHICKHMKE